jgi:lipopolysaccharide/colanic/teichoic acid biosynthesis glycosyltransferase
MQRMRIDVIFSPICYMELLSERMADRSSLNFLSTFVGGRRDAEEFFIRIVDILGSLLILLLFGPAMILAMAAIKLTSRGAILYKQERVGKDGRTFTMYKFRTMVPDAEKAIGPVLAVRGDARVTKVGRFLRDTRIDELPQLLNVLRGEMSLVGPRPERPHFVKLHKALREIRLAVKPGLTGLAQIRSVYDVHPKHKVKYDYLYIQRRSLLLNLYILGRTISVVLSRRGW